MIGWPSGSTTERTAAIADGQGSPRAAGSGPVSGTQTTVSAGVLVGRLTDGAGDERLGEGATVGDGLSEGEGAGEQAASRAHKRAAAATDFMGVATA